MFDVWDAVQWWEEWQLRILVLASLGFQWFLLLAAPMRKYNIHPWFRSCIWLAYISSDALAIYALATLFNRHARATTPITAGCGLTASNTATILEVLWAPVLLIHLGGQEELTAFDIEDNELWTRHIVTLVSQVAVALYAFYKSWPGSRDRLLLSSAILLFVIGVISFCEKPLALKRASIHRLAEISAVIQGTKKRKKLDAYLDQYFLFDSLNCFTMLCGGNKSSRKEPENGPSSAAQEQGRHRPATAVEEAPPPILTDADKVYMVLSDMSLRAAADDLVNRSRGRAREVKMEDVLKPLSSSAERGLQRWLRGAFGLIYTRVNVAFTRKYLVYHLVVVPVLHIAALALFAASDKHGYNRTDVKITYIILCLTAALDVLALFIRQLLYQLLTSLRCPALCEMVPGHNIIDEVLRRKKKDIGRLLLNCATCIGRNEGDLDCCTSGCCNDDKYKLYKKVSGMVLLDLVKARDRDPASYRVFTVPPSERDVTVVHVDELAWGADVPVEQWERPSAAGWTLSEDLQKVCTPVIRKILRLSFDRSVLVWHIATDLCSRVDPTPHSMHKDCAVAISDYMVRLLNVRPDMLLTGSRRHLVAEAMDEMERILGNHDDVLVDGAGKTAAPSEEQVRNIIREWAAASGKSIIIPRSRGPESSSDRCAYFRQAVAVLLLGKERASSSSSSSSCFHVAEACSLAKELLAIENAEMRWNLIYQVWLRMLCYSASMCRGYLHAKSLGEGGEFLSFVWLVLSLKGGKTLADKLQMVEPDTK